jgi:hypothetical protein
MCEALPESKNLSRIAAAQVTRAIPVMVSHLLNVKGNTRIASCGVVNFSLLPAFLKDDNENPSTYDMEW